MGRDERGREGEGWEGNGGEERGKGRGRRGKGRDGEDRRQDRPPKLKLGPQNYFPGAGAAHSAPAVPSESYHSPESPPK